MTQPLPIESLELIRDVCGVALFRGDQLEPLWGQLNEGLALAERCEAGEVGDSIACMLGFVCSLLRPGDGAGPNDREIEQRAHASGATTVICLHNILQMQRHYLLEDAAGALTFARKASSLLWAAECDTQTASVQVFEALSIAATLPELNDARRPSLRAEIVEHRAVLARLAEDRPSDFGHQLALVEAELAHIDGRDLEAIQLYERSIRLAEMNGFCQDQAIASERAAAVCSDLHLDAAARSYWRDARALFLHRGAHAKVALLDSADTEARFKNTGMRASIGDGSRDPLNLTTIIEVTHALSSEINMVRLIDNVLTIAVDRSEAEHGLLVLSRGEDLQLRACAARTHAGIAVRHEGRPIVPEDLPLAMLTRAIDRQRLVVVDDARQAGLYSADPYIKTTRPRSLLCVPLVRRGEVLGAIYLENNSASSAFNPARYAGLDLLAAQAAISLQNADLFARLEQEITERRQSEAALRISEERYALAIEAATDGHAEWLVKEDIFYASPQLLSQWGLPSDKTIWRRQELLDVFPLHPEDRPRVVALLEAGRRGGGKRLEYEARVILNGEERWMHNTIVYKRDSDGEAVKTSAAITDITARRRAEEALRKSEERYALALAGSNESIFDLDLNTQQLYLDRRAQELLGVEPGEPLRSRDEWKSVVHVHPEDLARQAAAFEAHMSGQMPSYDIEVRYLVGTEIRWIRSRGRALRDPEGHAFRFIGTVSDATKSRLEHEEMQRLADRLRAAERFEAMGTLAAGIAHDFNNVLGAILGFGERALSRADDGTPQYHDLSNVVRAGERGRALVEAVLSFSRGAGGDRAPVHVELVTQEVIALLKAKLPDRIRLRESVQIGRAAVIGDPTQIHQLLMNLGANAMHAILGKGVLSIDVSLEDVVTTRHALVGEISQGRWVVLRVADSGVGMTPEVLSRIFDPFFTTRDAGMGTGLGLSLVLRIVTQAGGAIDVSSLPGVGSVFAIFLPYAGEAPEVPAAVSRPIPLGRGQRVLVVDDEAPLLELMVDELGLAGYLPEAVTSADAALALYRDDPAGFDALVTDQRMPGMSGDSLIREVRRINPMLPIILVSGYVGDAPTPPITGDSADELLAKPLRPNALAASLARAIAHRSRPDEI